MSKGYWYNYHICFYVVLITNLLKIDRRSATSLPCMLGQPFLSSQVSLFSIAQLKLGIALLFRMSTVHNIYLKCFYIQNVTCENLPNLHLSRWHNQNTCFSLPKGRRRVTRVISSAQPIPPFSPRNFLPRFSCDIIIPAMSICRLRYKKFVTKVLLKFKHKSNVLEYIFMHWRFGDFTSVCINKLLFDV